MNQTNSFLAIGTLITSIHGESNSMDRGEVFTGPNAEGYIDRHIPDQETCYSVVFPKTGVSIFLTKAEAADTTSYTVGRDLTDGEILAFELDDEGKPTAELVQWDSGLCQTYISGESLEDYGMHNLRDEEAARLDLTMEQFRAAKRAFDGSDLLHDPSIVGWRLAIAFAATMRTWLSPEQMAEVVARNKASSNPSDCATHDFVDANMAMLEAFIATLRRQIRFPSDVEAGAATQAQVDWDTNVTNLAWEKAKAAHFDVEGLTAVADESIIDEATNAALDVACAQIQQYLGSADGGFAGMFFSGSGSDELKAILADYLKAERAHAAD